MRELLVYLVEWIGVISVTMLIAISPAFQKRRPLIFVYPRREGILALVIFVWVMLVRVAAAVYTPQTLFDPAIPAIQLDGGLTASVQRFSPGLDTPTLLIAILLVAPVILSLLIRRQPILSTGLARPLLRPGLQLGLALALITLFLLNKTYSILRGLTPQQWGYLPITLVTGLAVEWVFRGFIQLRLVAWLGQVQGWLASSGLYALTLIPQKLLVEHSSLAVVSLSLMILFALGLVMGWIMRKTGSVLAPGIYHAFHNWLIMLT